MPEGGFCIRISEFDSARWASQDIADAHLGIRVWQEANGQNKFRDIADSQGDLSDIDASYIEPGGMFFVAHEPDGSVAGFVGVRPHPELENGAVLKRLAVLPDYQRLGVGTRLVKHAVEWTSSTANFRQVTLATGRNENAHDIYGDYTGCQPSGLFPRSPQTNRMANIRYNPPWQIPLEGSVPEDHRETSTTPAGTVFPMSPWGSPSDWSSVDDQPEWIGSAFEHYCTGQVAGPQLLWMAHEWVGQIRGYGPPPELSGTSYDDWLASLQAALDSDDRKDVTGRRYYPEGWRQTELFRLHAEASAAARGLRCRGCAPSGPDKQRLAEGLKTVHDQLKSLIATTQDTRSTPDRLQAESRRTADALRKCIRPDACEVSHILQCGDKHWGPAPNDTVEGVDLYETVSSLPGLLDGLAKGELDPDSLPATAQRVSALIEAVRWHAVQYPVRFQYT